MVALTAPEIAALAQVDQAKLGDAHALLALAILASAGERDAASYDRYRGVSIGSSPT